MPSFSGTRRHSPRRTTREAIRQWAKEAVSGRGVRITTEGSRRNITLDANDTPRLALRTLAAPRRRGEILARWTLPTALEGRREPLCTTSSVHHHKHHGNGLVCLSLGSSR